MRIHGPVVVMALAALLAGSAIAESPFTSASAAGVPAPESAPVAPDGGAIPLILDDGTAENAIGLTNGGQFLWLNRFTPSPADYPFLLTEVHVLFRSLDGINVGELFDVYVYEDFDSNPATGATFLGSETLQAVAVLDAFTVIPIDPPILLATPGDVLIAIANETAGIAAGTFVAAIDQTASQSRSWVGFGAQPLPDPPTLPLATFGIIDSFGFPGNWMIRGVGIPAYVPPITQEIPTLGVAGIAALAVALAGAAFWFARRRRQA